MLTKTYQKVCETCAPWTNTLIRVALAILFINHGYDKLFGDTAALLAYFESTVLPAPGAMLLIAGILEFFGGMLLLFGLLTKYISYLLMVQFLVIILFIHLSLGIDGLEMDFVIFAALFSLGMNNAGKLSIDGLIQSRKIGSGAGGGHGAEAIGG